MKTFPAIALLGILALGCLRGSVPSDAEPVIARFLVAASVGDSATVAQLTTGDEPRKRVAAMHEHEPDLLRAVQSNRKLQSSVVRGDSAYVAFRVPLNGRTEDFAIGLVRQSGAWMVYHVAMAGRM